MKFYFNNKLNKHLRSDQHSKWQQLVKKIISKQIVNISIVISTHDHTNHKNFAFREHQYARVKKVFESRSADHELCANSGIFMSLINRKFLEENVSEISIKKTTSNLKIRDIESKIHDISTYCSLDLYFQEHIENQSMIAHIKREFHFVNDFQINIFIYMNIMGSRKCILNFRIKNMIFSTC
jgi:hypothetical protein